MHAFPLPPTILLDEFPQLATLAWNRDPRRPIPIDEAFSLYEANWHRIEIDRLSPEEADFVDRLMRHFAGGASLARGRT